MPFASRMISYTHGSSIQPRYAQSAVAPARTALSTYLPFLILARLVALIGLIYLLLHFRICVAAMCL